MLLIRSKGGFVAECLLPSLIPCVIIKASSNDAATHRVIAPPKRGRPSPHPTMQSIHLEQRQAAVRESHSGNQIELYDLVCEFWGMV